MSFLILLIDWQSDINSRHKVPRSPWRIYKFWRTNRPTYKNLLIRFHTNPMLSSLIMNSLRRMFRYLWVTMLSMTVPMIQTNPGSRSPLHLLIHLIGYILPMNSGPTPKISPSFFHHPLDGVGVLPMVTHPSQRRRLLYTIPRQLMQFIGSDLLWDLNRHCSRPRFAMLALRKLSPEPGPLFAVSMQ